MKAKLHLFRYFVICIICIGIIVTATFMYAKSVYKQTKIDISQIMQDAAAKTSYGIREQVDLCVMFLYGVSELLAFQDASYEERKNEVLNLLERIEAKSPYIYLGVADAEGRLYHASKEMQNVSDLNWFRSAAAGTPAFTRIQMEGAGAGSVGLLAAVPVIRGGEVQGVAVGVVCATDLDDMLFIELLGEPGYQYLIQSDGKVIASGGEIWIEDVYAIAARLDDCSQEDISQLFEHMDRQETAFAHFHRNGHLYHALYTPVGRQGWYLISAVPNNLINVQTADIIQKTVFFTIFVVGVVALAFILLFYALWKSYRILHTAYQEVDSIYQAVPIALFKFYLDEKLSIKRANDAFYRLIGCSRTEYQVHYQNVFSTLLASPDISAIEHYDSGIMRREFEICCANGEVKWVYGAFALLRKEPTPLIQCTLTNMTTQKEQMRTYEADARLDSLTNLKNLRAVKEEIARLLQNMPSFGGALFLFDLDNFKRVNDTLGHAEGDRLLKEFAGLLQTAFTEEAILGRQGGDEFMAFVPGCSIERATELLSKIFALVKERLDGAFLACGLSVSAGAVLTNSSEDSMGDIYTCADKALYAAKRSGKGRYCFYHAGLASLFSTTEGQPPL